jgi:phosphoribosylformylglycinamidine synthase
MVGILEREDSGCDLRFPAAGLDIVLLGETAEELGGSEWQQVFAAAQLAQPPRVDLARERALVELLLDLHEQKLLGASHDLANGGLAVALAESALGGVGCNIELGEHARDLDAIALLFSESQARAIVASAPEHTDAVLARAQAHGFQALQIGRTVDAAFLIERNGVPLIRTTTAEISRVWSTAFALLLGGDSAEDVIRGVGEEAPEVMAH